MDEWAEPDIDWSTPGVPCAHFSFVWDAFRFVSPLHPMQGRIRGGTRRYIGMPAGGHQSYSAIYQWPISPSTAWSSGSMDILYLNLTLFSRSWFSFLFISLPILYFFRRAYRWRRGRVNCLVSCYRSIPNIFADLEDSSVAFSRFAPYHCP